MTSSYAIRSEQLSLAIDDRQRQAMTQTIVCYRKAVRALSTLIMTHWPELQGKHHVCMQVESLFHATAKRHLVKYPMLDRLLGNMPSYLRRAAIEAAYGAVSSYLSNLNHWITDQDRERGSKAPRLGLNQVNPPLYGGNMIVIGKDFKQVQIKVIGVDGRWQFTSPIRVKGKLKRISFKKNLCPSLIGRGKQFVLSCPSQVARMKYVKNTQVERVCAIDVGINTAATAAIVDVSGTVIARQFFTIGRHNDQRDKLATQIASRQQQTQPKKGTKGFCQTLFRRISHLSVDAARTLASQAVSFARSQGAQVMVLEDLKGWKPKSPSKKKRHRFHRFQHRLFVNYLQMQCEEWGIRVMNVYPRGTSRWAFDGSGIVKRNTKNVQLAVFANQKQFNADLNAAYNIAARGIAAIIKLVVPRLNKSADTGKSPGSASRMPIVLADIWNQHQVSC
jgi:IS605 OrfB family transposase